MKYLDKSMGIQLFLSGITKSNCSSTRDSKAGTISNRLSRFYGLSVSVALGTLLVALVLSPSMGMYTRGGSVVAFAESISVFGSDCETATASFTWGDTVCARVTGAFPNQRRFVWVTPTGLIAQQTPIISDPQTDTFSLDIGLESIFRQPGTWSVRTINNDAESVVAATFVVRDTVPKADLAIIKSGPSAIGANNNITYTITVFNRGPDDADSVTVADPAPANTAFVSATGPSGACSSSSCTLTTLAANSSAVFTYVYNVNSGAEAGTIISNTASVSSSTSDPRPVDNSATFETTVVEASTAPCTINCPGNLSFDNDPSAANPCVKAVTFSTPVATGSCDDPETGQSSAVACSPPSGSEFPIGSTTVTCSNGAFTCSFNIEVHDTRPAVQPTIDCPSDVTVNEQPEGSGSAMLTFTPIATGNCVNISCVPPSGSSFPVGTTTVNCTASAPSGQSASCSFHVTVTSATAACELSCAADITQTASSCNGVVISYPAPGTSGNCGTVTCSPSSGSTFPVGTTIVTCTSDQGPSCDFTVTIAAPAPPTITTCATNKTRTAGANCESTIPDLTHEVVTAGCSVVVSQSPAAGTTVGIGDTVVTITAENSAGDTSCTATVTVTENTPPVITCPADTSASANSNCQAPVPNVVSGAVASDNCTDAGSLTITQSPAAGTLVGLGTNTITITAKDAANNSATCTTTFTVIDTTPPTAVCKNITVVLDASGNASITAAQVDNGSSDNCGIASRTVSPSAFTCANQGPNTVTLTVKDSSNNTATCQATVTVVDNTPPTISCTSDINVDFNPAVGGAVVTYATPVGADNCAGATTTQIAGLPSGATFPVGTTTNTFRVTDAAGLTAQCSFKITVALTSIIGLNSVSLSGGGLIDSYDSTGGYPATKGSLANVLSNGTITISGGPKVFGNVRSTRVGVVLSGGSQVTGNATAGTTVSLSGGSTVGGTITNNQLSPLIVLPAVSACGPAYSSNSGITGTYTYNASTGNLTVSGGNIATLANGAYCFNNVTLSGGAQLKVNGPVVIKLTGTLNVSGGSFTNTTAIPANLRILSSYSGSNGVTLSGGSNAHLVVYAPRTGVTLSGGSPVFGAVVGKTLTLSANSMIHYDTRLLSIWPDLWVLISGQ